MKRTLAVAYMEARERAILLPIALTLGVALVVVPALGSPDADVAESGQAALALAAVTSCVFALVLGVSTPVRDAVTRRLSFYFARPLSPLHVWAGRVTGLAVLVGTCGLLVLLPAAILGASPELPDHAALSRLSLGVALALLAGASLTLLVVGNALSAALHAPARWAIPGLAIASGVGALSTHAVRRLIDYGAAPQAVLGVGAFGALALVTGLLAGWVHVAHARADSRRGIAALFVVLWGGLGAGSVGLDAWSRDVLDVVTADIRPHGVRALGSGRFVLLQGMSADAPTGLRSRATPTPPMTVTMLLDVRSGRHLELARSVPSALPGVIDDVERGCPPMRIAPAGDESVVAWTCDPGLTLRLAQLGDAPALLDVAVRSDATGGDFLPLDGGRRLVVVRADRSTPRLVVEAVDVATGAAAWSRAMTEHVAVRLLAADAEGDGVLVVVHDPDRTRNRWPMLMRVREGAEPELLATLESAWDLRFDVDLASRRILVSPPDRQSGEGRPAGPARVLSMDTGRELLLSWLWNPGTSAWLLSDGRILTIGPADPPARHAASPETLMAPIDEARIANRVRIHAKDGDNVRITDVVDLAWPGRAVVPGECAPGRVVACVEGGGDAWSCSLIDIDARSASPLPEDLQPLEARPGSAVIPAVRLVPVPGSPRTMLFVTDDALVLFDPLTGERRRVAGAGS